MGVNAFNAGARRHDWQELRQRLSGSNRETRRTAADEHRYRHGDVATWMRDWQADREARKGLCQMDKQYRREAVKELRARCKDDIHEIRGRSRSEIKWIRREGRDLVAHLRKRNPRRGEPETPSANGG